MKSQYWGKFCDGDLVTRWVTGESRDMIIQEPIEFNDRRGCWWYAWPSDRINGASVPRFFWRVFPAYIGLYRRATVFHDVACEKKSEPSWKVHRMFYEAMRCDGVGPIQAWIMWAAVRMFGPRFPGLKAESADK